MSRVSSLSCESSTLPKNSPHDSEPCKWHSAIDDSKGGVNRAVCMCVNVMLTLVCICICCSIMRGNECLM